MPLPANLASVIEDAPLREGDYFASGDRHCEGAKFHSPSPLMLHDVRLFKKGPVVLVCGTCRDNLAILTDLMEDNDGELPWIVRREFGNLIRALAEDAWKAVHG